MKHLFCLFTLLLCLLTNNLHSDVLLHSSDPGVQEILSTLKSIPPEFRDNKYTIHVQSVSDREALLMGFYESGLLGVTFPEEKHIFLLRDRAKRYHWSLRNILYHEYGHEVWFLMMTEEEKGVYTHLWLAETINGQNPTEYGASSPEEGFAEACRLEWSKAKVNKEESLFLYQLKKRLGDVH